jgi:hypothetical protein
MVTDMLAGGAWAGIETAVHDPHHMRRRLRPFSNLQFVGHMRRVAVLFRRLDVIPMATTKLKRPIINYLKENVHYTFSGMNFPLFRSAARTRRRRSDHVLGRLSLSSMPQARLPGANSVSAADSTHRAR